ncbi:MAG: triose-phosphate isomerase [Deltaproteobacteria bacterium RBG_13_61_14]|nr:MAG: triose-phosphate isomerase [Deltaproteobacteria bacterium RBG_13_61_14]
MRKPFIAGNWKMNLTTREATALAKKLVESLAGVTQVEIGIAPVYTVLPAVAAVVRGSNVQLLAQNLFWVDSGAYTGEVSGPMLKDAGCSHVIVGHSERRQHFGETDESVNKKLKAAFASGLVPIFCVGETLAEREQGRTFAVVERQVKGGLQDIPATDAAKIVVAYEPVWAIGTGKTATPAQAQEVHAQIRSLLARLYGQELADQVRIQYGGSVKADNIAELMQQPDLDGALVGGASLKADSFTAIVRFQG